MVDDWKQLEDRMLSGEHGDALRALAASGEAKRLAEKLDASSAERALRSGDPAQMRALLDGVLATEEGRALARMLSALGQGK